ncbi:hypothetical protein JCM3765_005485 [Sporobolomyces pararoseus]
MVNQTKQCLICEKKSSIVCSGCKEIGFCSEECQKLVSAAHEWLCGKFTSTFSFPPLSQQERKDLDQYLKTQPYDHVCDKCSSIPQTKKKGATLFEHVCSLGLFKGNWDTFLNSITIGGDLIKEPRLSAILVLVRNELDKSWRTLDLKRPGRVKLLKESIYNGVARSFSPMISCRDSKEHFSSFLSNPLRRFNSFLRQIVIVKTLYTRTRDERVNLLPQLQIASQRLMKEKSVLQRSLAVRGDIVTWNKTQHAFETHGRWRHLDKEGFEVAYERLRKLDTWQ